jgi:DEAD/DEAH box helicase domain-containing protein
MRYLVFDIESVSASGSNVRGKIDLDDQELTMLALYDSLTDSYSSYLKSELPQLWPLMERADLLIGFNSDSFDIPLLNRYYPGDLSKIPSLDLLTEVYKALGRRVRLDSLAQATLGRGKSGDGLKAVTWWHEGLIEKVREYCIDDVRLTKELFDYALKNGLLKYKDLRDVRDLKIDTSTWGKSALSPALTHTLSL